MEQVLVPTARRSPLALFDLISAEPLPEEGEGEAHALQLAIRAGGASLAFAAVYGVAAGCTVPWILAANLVKLPVVVLLSLGASLPVGLLAWKVVGGGWRLSSLAVSVATGVFTATLVLACASPLIALYYLTTEGSGAPLALASVALALAAGVGNAFRAALARRPEGVRRRRIVLPMTSLLVALLLALLQLVHLASPILPEQTVFDQGVEGLVGHR